MKGRGTATPLALSKDDPAVVTGGNKDVHCVHNSALRIEPRHSRIQVFCQSDRPDRASPDRQMTVPKVIGTLVRRLRFRKNLFLADTGRERY
jgi:hypothetical protein